MTRPNFNVIRVSTEAKLHTYLFSSSEEHGMVFLSSIKSAEEAQSALLKALRRLESPSHLTYTRLNISSDYSTGFSGSGPIRPYTPVVNGVAYKPRSIWACRSYVDSPVEYRISSGDGGGTLISRKEFIAELKVLVWDCLEVELHDKAAAEALWSSSQS